MIAPADVWALRCLLHELATLRPPFEATNQAALVMKILENRRGPLPGMYSPELAGLVERLLVADPEDRPSIHELLSGHAMLSRLVALGVQLPLELEELAQEAGLDELKPREPVRHVRRTPPQNSLPPAVFLSLDDTQLRPSAARREIRAGYASRGVRMSEPTALLRPRVSRRAGGGGGGGGDAGGYRPNFDTRRLRRLDGGGVGRYQGAYRSVDAGGLRDAINAPRLRRQYHAAVPPQAPSMRGPEPFPRRSRPINVVKS